MVYNVLLFPICVSAYVLFCFVCDVVVVDFFSSFAIILLRKREMIAIL